MGYTIVLSGPAYQRTQVGAALRQAGLEVEQGNEDSHGFERDGELSFITAHGGDVDAAGRAVEPFGWSLRSHWAATGPWRKVGGSPLDEPDPMGELAKLKAQLRAAGINLGAE